MVTCYIFLTCSFCSGKYTVMEEKTKEYSTRMQLHIKDFQVKVLEEDQLIKCQLKHIKDFLVKVLEEDQLIKCQIKHIKDFQVNVLNEEQLVKCQLKSISFQGFGYRSLHFQYMPKIILIIIITITMMIFRLIMIMTTFQGIGRWSLHLHIN